MTIPLLIQLDTEWKDISEILLSEFKDDENIEIVLEVYKSLEYEILIDKTAELVINESYNGKGIRLDKDLNKIEITVKSQYKYYARAIKTIADLRALLAIQQNNIGLLGTGNEEIGSIKGALNVHDADVHNDLVNKSFHTHEGVTTTLAEATTGDGTEYQITVVNAVGFAVDDYLHI